MRLWHKDLIPYLPKKQLLGQWKILDNIFRLKNKDNSVSFIYEYDKNHLLAYSNLVIDELNKRNIEYNDKKYNDYFYGYGIVCYKKIAYEDIYSSKMNNRYLKQCLYNLQEKYDCDGISHEEWSKILEKFSSLMQ